MFLLSSSSSIGSSANAEKSLQSLWDKPREGARIKAKIRLPRHRITYSAPRHSGVAGFIAVIIVACYFSAYKSRQSPKHMFASSPLSPIPASLLNLQVRLIILKLHVYHWFKTSRTSIAISGTVFQYKLKVVKSDIDNHRQYSSVSLLILTRPSLKIEGYEIKGKEGFYLFKMFGLTRHGKQFFSCSSFTPFDYVDEDTLVEIISRLPIKCMVRSTCVCKQWHRLISVICVPRIKSSPPHALLFSLCTSSPKPVKGPMTLAWTNSPDQDFTSLNDLCSKLPFTPSPRDFLDCCNGVFLFFCQLTREFFLCNPTTEQCLPIPNSPQNDIPDFAALFFDPHCKICYISKLFPLTVNLFSIQTRQWSVHKFLVRPPSAAINLISRHVFVNGFLYCLSFDAYLLGINIKKQMRVHTLHLPEVVTAKEHPVGCIGVSQGRLHYAWGNREYYVMVWMLGKGGISDGWVLKYTISRQYFVQHPLSRNSNFCLVHAFDPTSNAFFVCTARNLFRYDPDNKKLETVCRIKKGTYICAGQYLVYPFSPSLTTLDAPSRSINN